MAEQSATPDVEKAVALLETMWREVLASDSANEVDPAIGDLVNSQFVSIRYCLPTQVLGKLVCPQINCLCLQKGAADCGNSWDPRSFCSKTVVPWVARNQSVLGTSADPYVGKPLRKGFIETSPGNVKGKTEWQSLYEILKEIEETNSTSFTQRRFRQILFAIKERLAKYDFEYPLPERISLEQAATLVERFLAESSGGDRGLSVAAALFETLGEHFGLYREVKRQVVNAPDASTGFAADIECYGAEGNLRLAVEVKERGLTFTDVHGALGKARRASLKELLFNAPGFAEEDVPAIQEVFSKSWASGTNLYQLSIDDLIRVGLSLTGESGRKSFLLHVGQQLDQYNTQPLNRKRWKELLEEL